MLLNENCGSHIIMGVLSKT